MAKVKAVTLLAYLVARNRRAAGCRLHIAAIVESAPVWSVEVDITRDPRTVGVWVDDRLGRIGRQLGGEVLADLIGEFGTDIVGRMESSPVLRRQ